MAFVDYLRLIRVQQWYKNGVIFLPLFFIGQFFSLHLLSSVFVGFASLCFISSVNYVINDIKDRDKDRLHPEKKHRALASKKVSSISAMLFAGVLFLLGMAFAYALGLFFFLAVLFLFFSSLFYTFFLKQILFADIITIAVNFVIRIVSGALILKIIISPWIVVCPFFLALFLAVGKRDADARTMKAKATTYNPVLKHYTPEITHALMIISGTALLLSYALYSFTRTHLMLATVPFAVYALFKYFYLVRTNSVIARHPELMYRDRLMMVSLIIWALLVFFIFYVIMNQMSLLQWAVHA